MFTERNRAMLGALSIFLLALLVVGAGISVAGDYQGLEPGISKKSDADRVLGAPKEEIERGVMYDYSPPADDIRRVTIKFSKKKQTIEKIDIYPRVAYIKGQYMEWFELKEADLRKEYRNGRLVEYYISEGIALHYSGSGDSSTVEFFSYFDRSLLDIQVNKPPIVPQRDRPVYLLMDDFDLENKSKGALNFSAFTNWEVVDGTVDIIGNGFYDFYPEHGLYVDLDGSTAKAGTLVSKTSFRLEPGKYRLQFDLAGSPLSGPNTVNVELGSVYRAGFTLAMKAPFETVVRDIPVSSPVSAKLSFRHSGGDNQGLLLDNIKLMKIPDSQIPPKRIPPPKIEKDENYYIQQADIALDKKNFDRAKQMIEEGLRKHPNSAKLWHSRASYYFKNKSEARQIRDREATRSMEKAYRLNPSATYAADMGWVYHSIHGDCKAALYYFEEAERKGYAKKQKSLLYWMGRCYEERNDPLLSKYYYRRFLDVAPKDEKASDARDRMLRLR